MRVWAAWGRACGPLRNARVARLDGELLVGRSWIRCPWTLRTQSDPLVVVFQKTPEGTLEEVGRTEYLK